MTAANGIDPSRGPSGTGCMECDLSGDWWVHLRRCAQCGHVGCCDSSPNQHARHHAEGTGHPVIQSFEPGQAWFYDFTSDRMFHGPDLAPPRHRPQDQPSPGPHGRVPPDWRDHLH